MKKLKVLALTDNVIQSLRYVKGFRNFTIINFSILIANNHYSKLRFIYNIVRQLIKFSIRNKILFVVFFLKRKIIIINRPLAEIRTYIIKHKYDIGLHNMGIIYRKDDINAFTYGIINAHIGKLPEFRGRSVMEWSMLNNIDTGVTCFFIDEGIDTGKRIICYEPFSLEHCSNILQAKEYLFNQDIEMFKSALNKIINNDPCEENDITKGKRYYKMSGLFSGIVEQLFVQ